MDANEMNLGYIREDLVSCRGNPDAYWNDRSLLNAYVAFIYDNTRLRGVGISRYEVDRAEILYKEILHRMGSK